MTKKALLTIFMVSFFISALTHTAAFSADTDGIDTKLTTSGLDKPYEILGLVSYRSSVLDPEKIIDELRKKGKALKADYLIGIQFYSHAGYLYGTGTAVRLLQSTVN